MSFTDVLKKSFPFISAAASLGGPVGTMAASLVGKAIGIDKVPATADGISNAIATALADPTQRAALIQAEQQFQLQMAELGYKNAEELASTAAADRADARAMQEKTQSKMPQVLAALAILTLAFCIYMVGFRTLPASGHDAIILLLGAVIGITKDVYGYTFGSSAGSDRKTELLAQAPSIQK
jgi:CDP-diglyceride synthetase